MGKVRNLSRSGCCLALPLILAALTLACVLACMTLLWDTIYPPAAVSPSATPAQGLNVVAVDLAGGSQNVRIAVAVEVTAVED